MGKRADALIRDADWAAEQAARALRDRAFDHAIRWSDRAVPLTRKVIGKNRADRRAVDIFAERLWDRALIHQGLGNAPAAIRDAGEALALTEEMDRAHGVQYQLRAPSMRLLLCELHAAAGDSGAARRYGHAIDDYRRHLEPTLLIADGFARYGEAMRTIGDPSAAPAFRQAVDLYRSPEVRLLERSDVERFIGAAIQVATDAEPANPAAAPEILPILQDVAEWTVRMVPQTYPVYATPENHADARAALDVLERLGVWLRTLGAPRLADYYDTLAAVYPRDRLDDGWFWWHARRLVGEGGRLLGEAVRRRGDPPGTPQRPGAADGAGAG